ncbi:hypothetical protein TL16_g04252 [Triparma laevis f. inornata]|uniref:UDP-glucose 4-epimerase n=2 Tax=Triparma laevis TaxID=1534972 RepID=A0A9W6Z788_9STRA|nr:hypothetical protein TrLO_g2557 [Triparma laevis f. longispina]GMH65655.1 hypothetical protein TL16_g04252 [Triparma laevis f. inornata]
MLSHVTALLLLLLLHFPLSTLSLPPPTILITGGAGYIGSHTCLDLLSSGESLVVYDDLSNSSPESLHRVNQLVKRATSAPGQIHFREGDVRDPKKLNSVLTEFPTLKTCVHFAGLKAVGESSQIPLEYYDVNIAGSINLLKCLQNHSVPNFVFSSSATVYGDPESLPIPETAKLTSTNPYGRTKLFIEELLRDCHSSSPSFWNILILRYFNPIGAHSSGLIGEDPKGIPNNLMPFISQVCVGRRERVSVFGGDYETEDGTGVRDYIHVVDLARGHSEAIKKLRSEKIGCEAVNLGTGKGYSVLDLINGMGRATGSPVPYTIVDRRPGDVASCYCDPRKAEELLGWKAELGVEECCEDTWRWQVNNPEGYKVVEKKVIESEQ